jgi:thiamine biosynthesis lipoprotein
MGTRFEFVVAHADAAHAHAAAEAAAEEVLRLHTLWSPFEPSSIIAALNRDARARAVRVDADTFALLTLCNQVHAQSGGAFDITIGHLMREFGFRSSSPLPEGGAGGGFSSSSSPPSSPSYGSHHLHLDAATRTVHFTAPISLDLGAVAKGWALDSAAAVLRDAGIAHALLHAGTSSVLAVGPQPDGRPWRIRLTPDAAGPVVELRDNALSVSAPHGRTGRAGCGVWGLANGESCCSLPPLPTPHSPLPTPFPPHLSHTIDPRSGTPTAPRLHAAVMANTAALADAWSTAVLVNGGAPASPPCLTIITQSRDDRWHANEPQAPASGHHCAEA